MSKEEVLERLYSDPKLAINSVKKLYNEAIKEQSMTYKFVEEWYKKRDENQRSGYRKDNSWVGNEPREEYQVDVAYMTFLSPELRGGYDYALVCIDVFSKRAWVVPIGEITASATAAAIKICFAKMKGSPSYVMSDKGVEFTGKAFKDALAENGSSQEFTRTHATFAERFIFTMKNYMIKKTSATKKSWVELLSRFLRPYNNEERENTTKMTPKEASKDQNMADVRVNLVLKAKRERKYPPLQVGDEVKIWDKGKGIGGEKISHSKWAPERYKVEAIEWSLGMKHYRLEGKDSLYLRHELLKV